MNTTVSEKKLRLQSGSRSGEIYNSVRQDIVNMFPGAALPPIKHLQKIYSAGQSTIVKIIGMLEDEGLIVRKPRKGIFVSEKALIHSETNNGVSPFYPEFLSVPRDHVTFAIPEMFEVSMWNHLINVFNNSGSHVPVRLKQVPNAEIISPAAPDKTMDMAIFSHPFGTINLKFNSLDWLDLSPFLSTLDKNEYYEKTFISDGENRVWGAAPYLISPFICINKDILRECGQGMPELSWGWEDFLSYSVMLKESIKKPGIKWIFILMGYMNYFFHAGVSFVDEKTGQYTVNTPAMKEAVVFLKKMLLEEKVSPMWWSERCGKSNYADMFESRMAVMAERYSYHCNSGKEDFKPGMAPMPLAKGGTRTLCCFAMGINNLSLNIEDCWEFLKFVLSEQGQNIVAEHTGHLPARKSVLPQKSFPELVKIQQQAVREGEFFYSGCENLYFVRNIIEAAVKKWLRLGGDLDMILRETEMVCRWQIDKFSVKNNGGGR